MSMRMVVSCDGAWDVGLPCRGALPTHTTIAELAAKDARAAGWSMSADRDDYEYGEPDHGDLCPAHARRLNAARRLDHGITA